MRTRVVGLVALSLTSCWKANDFYFASGSGTGSAGGSSSGASSGTEPTTATTEPLNCSPPAGRGTAASPCALEAPAALSIGNHPAFKDTCASQTEVWAQVNDGDGQIVDVCTQDCADCDTGLSLDLTSATYQFLTLLNAVAPQGVCMRVLHEGELIDPTNCRTRRLAVWDEPGEVLRFALSVGVDEAVSPLPGVPLAIERDTPFMCECSDADKMNTDDYPCCAQSPVQYHDLLVTPTKGCTFRALSGVANAERFQLAGEVYDFILYKDYQYVAGCPQARETSSWSVNRVSD